MKNIILKRLFISALMFTFTAHAGLYKGLDEEGNVTYSDKPSANSEIIVPPPLTVVDAPKIKPKEEAVEEEPAAEYKYTSFSISSPKDQQTIWNEPDLGVSLQLTPALNTADGHNIWLLMDGKPLVKNSQSLTLQIGRSDRGAHQLQAQIRNKEGKIIKRSQKITVHIKNAVIKKQPLKD
jgi:hypothetical protein